MTKFLKSCCLTLLLSTSCGNAFTSQPMNAKSLLCLHQQHSGTQLKAKNFSSEGKEYWLDEFKTANGEILNPYKVLKIPRDSTLDVIKHAYREQSKRFHPDKQRFRDVLPGRCNDLEDVRDEWERIKLSYEILRDPRSRKRYDRHEVLADPGAAVGRAVTDAALNVVGKGLSGVGSGIFALGAFALDKLSATTE